VLPAASIFPDVPQVRRVNVYRGTVMVRNFAPETSLETIRRTLYDEREYGDFILKPVLHTGPVAEPNLPLRVDPPLTDPIALEVALERATMEKAQDRLERASTAEIEARSRQSEAEYKLRIARAEGDALTARMELDQVKAQLEQMRLNMTQRMETQRDQIESDAQRRIDRMRDAHDLDAERAKMRLDSAVERHAQELATVRERLQSQIDLLTGELSRERADRVTAQRALEKEREASAAREREHHDQVHSLKAKLANVANPEVQRVHAMGEMARVIGSAPDETRSVLVSMLSAEAGVSPPSKVDQLVEMVVSNPQIQDVFGRVVEKMFAEKEPQKALPERKDL